MRVSKELRVATAAVIDALTKEEFLACATDEAFVVERVVALMAANATGRTTSSLPMGRCRTRTRPA